MRRTVALLGVPVPVLHIRPALRRLAFVPAEAAAARPSLNWAWIVAGVVAAASTVTALADEKKGSEVKKEPAAPAAVDDTALRADLETLLASNPKYDDGSYGPLLVRLAWHASGTFDKGDSSGGSGSGASMRFGPEAEWGANAGLKVARDLLEPLKAKYPAVSYADLWSLAGAVAIEALGGPHIQWRPGRRDVDSAKHVPLNDGRLPDANKGADHLRAIFGRMGFNDQEIVALSGAHALGRGHADRSGYDGPWTNSPTVFSNDFFVQLVETKWTPRQWKGPLQYTDPSGKLMMLPSDLALVQDAAMKKHVEAYAKDEALFFKDFAAAFQKLEELGVKFPEKPEKGHEAAADKPKAAEAKKP